MSQSASLFAKMGWPLVTGIVLAGVIFMMSGPGAESNKEKYDEGKQLSVSLIVDSTNQFGIELYKTLQANDDNMIISPLSVASVLAMTSLGAKGNTLQELMTTLHLAEYHSSNVHRQLHLLLEKVMSQQNVTVKSANGLWVSEAYPILSSFIGDVEDKYNAEARNVDFAQSEDARKEINKWVSKKTERKVEDLLPPGSITETVAFVLTNAIYFKGSWKKRFESAGSGVFHTIDNKESQVEYMRVKAPFKTGYERDGARIIEIPYSGGSSMYVILPRDDFRKFENSVSLESLKGLLDKVRGGFEGIELKLPKFVLSRSYSLNENLKTLGVHDLLKSGLADLSGIDGSRLLFVSKVFHQGFIAVDEEGTEAAGGSAVVGNFRSMPPPPFIADKPFLFLIRENETGSIIFMGRFINP